MYHYVQEHKVSRVCDSLLESVLGTLKPLLLGHTPESHPSEHRSLTPADEHTTGLLLQLALHVGIAVSDCIKALPSCTSGLGV